MRILVVGSCGKKKRIQLPNPPSCKDLQTRKHLSKWKAHLPHSLLPARAMYTGPQHRELLNGIEGLRTIKGVEVDFFIVSAGFGVLNENEMIPSYECSFNNMKKKDILERAHALGFEGAFRHIFRKEYDLLYIALGKKYMVTLCSSLLQDVKGVVVVFHKMEPNLETLYVPSGGGAVKSFSKHGFKIHGVVGFKGDLLRILSEYAAKQKNSYAELRSWMNSENLKSLIYELGGLDHKSSEI